MRGAVVFVAAALCVFALALPRCGADDDPPPPPAPPSAPAAESPAPAPVTASAPLWIVGDLHVHVTPPDAPDHSRLTVASAIDRARAAGIDFVVLTPHDAHLAQTSTARAAPPTCGQDLMVSLIRDAMARPRDPSSQVVGTPPRPLLAVPGWEYTREEPGHLGISFFRMSEILPSEKDGAGIADPDGAPTVKRALGRGALVVVNHPFFRPVRCAPALTRIMEAARVEWSGDWRWKPFFGIGTDDNLWNAIEVWHERSVLVEKMHATSATLYPDTQMLRAALTQWDRATLTQRRRITAVGGSDCHGKLPYALVPMKQVSVLVSDRSEEALRLGLLGAHATFGTGGGEAARDFAATSDVAGARAGIGDSLAAKSAVRLTWTGTAVLYEDGTRVGEFDGGAVRKVAPEGSFHFWRIEKSGDAYSNMIYGNLP